MVLAGLSKMGSVGRGSGLCSGGAHSGSVPSANPALLSSELESLKFLPEGGCGFELAGFFCVPMLESVLVFIPGEVSNIRT
jgi:hypothetical protein